MRGVRLALLVHAECATLANRCMPSPLPLSSPGLHSADNIHEFSNAMNMGLTLRDLKFNVHAHPTVAEVRQRKGGGAGAACSRQHYHWLAVQVPIPAHLPLPFGLLCKPISTPPPTPCSSPPPPGQRGADPPRAAGEHCGGQARGSRQQAARGCVSPLLGWGSNLL